MFDNIAFNVVIGLVFIYLLYSLLVTIVGEMLASWLGLRARILRTAIERMLNDGYYNKVRSKHGWSRLRIWVAGSIRRFFLYENDDFKKSFAGTFYEYPSIKYLSKLEADEKGIFGQSKPSYITAENFAVTLINLFSDKGAGADSMQKVDFCIRNNTLRLEPQTLQQFTNLLNNSTGDIAKLKTNLVSWFNETMDRCNGWYKRKVQFLLFWFGLIVAVSFNVDSIRIARILANDKEARNQLVTMGVALAKDSARYKDFISDKGDTVHSKAILDSGYARISKDLNAANLVLGLGWHFDTLTKKEQFELGREDSLWAVIYKGRLQKVADSLNTVWDQMSRTSQSIAALKDAEDQVAKDTLYSAEQIALRVGANKEALVAALKQTQDSIVSLERERHLLMLDNKKDTAVYRKTYAVFSSIKDTVNLLMGGQFVHIDGIDYSNDGRSLVISGSRKYSFGEKWDHFWYVTIIDLGILGFILTALALSLGAPFWFGVLNKLVSLRSAGVKPEEVAPDKKTPTASFTSDPGDKGPAPLPPPPPESPVDAALRIYSTAIVKEDGVLSVGKGYMRVGASTGAAPGDGAGVGAGVGTNAIPCVQVNVRTEADAVSVRAKFGSLNVGSDKIVPVNVLVTGDKPELRSGEFTDFHGLLEKGIANKNSLANAGTYGCLVKKMVAPDKTFLLSCYHVMNGEFSWDSVTKQATLINSTTEIATQFDGFLNSSMDIALAELTDAGVIDFYKKRPAEEMPRDVKEVTTKNVFETVVTIQGLSTANSTGLIVNDSKSESFDYPLGNHMVRSHQVDDLFIISHQEDDSPGFTGTKPGDSGAVILDKDNNALGFVIAGDKLHTYAIKASTVFGLLGLKLI